MSSHITSAKQRSRSPPKTRKVPIGRKSIIIGDESLSIKDNNKIVTSKYTLLTFVPKNLFEQFRRIANFYFLCIAVIQSTTNTPVSPATSLTPLVFVVTTTAVKQAYEDWIRHKHDKAANCRKVTVLTNYQLQSKKCEEIRIGDIIRIEDNEELPCDMIMLSSSNPEGKCHVTTANLDGETNLKVRMCLPLTQKFTQSTDFKDFNAVIECEDPNTDLYDFTGVMRVFDSLSSTLQFSLGPNNLLLRGARLRNTAFIFGTAVYTGQDTKMALNYRLTSNKFSSIEKTANKCLIIYLILLLFMSIFCTIIRSLLRDDIIFEKAWYLRDVPKQKNVINIILQDFLNFFVIFNYLIPISLYVSLELVKFFGSKTLVADANLCDANDEKPICNSSDLNEELGQVEYLFSDKTGTLTENTMTFRACTINGKLFEEKDNSLINISTGEVQNINVDTDVQKFFTALTLCNTVQVLVKDEVNEIDVPNSSSHHKVYEYQAASPDEKALVEASKRFDVTLIDATDKLYTLLLGSKVEKYKKLHTFEFDSYRKRMTVIVQNDNGEIMLICKGSDSEMTEVVRDGKIKETMEQVDRYAHDGLRTLVIAMKVISAHDYAKIESDLHDAMTSLENRNEKLLTIQNDIEIGLTILGATAVEDSLQEDVYETICDLKSAGIKIWVLTGDKMETTVSVGYSCALLNAETIQLHLVRQQNSDACGEILSRYLTIVDDLNVSHHSEYAFIIDGRSLYMAMKYYKEKFRKICENCSVVLCCRMSPIQKAEVIRLMKESPSSPVTAAIGDGANDVSMLQEAHVGLGIMGKEGRQAVNSSDFAFAKFKFVKRILLVHGHLFYLRVSILIQYFFYKNVVFITPQFLYAFYSAFSAQTLYHSMLLMMYNMAFTAGPIFVYGLAEKHIPSMVLSAYPELYMNIKRNANMTFRKFLIWFFTGVWHGSVSFFGFLLLCGSTNSLLSDGQFGGLYAFGILTYHCVIFIVIFKLVIITRFWNYYFISTVVISVVILPLFLLLYTNFKWGIFDEFYSIFGLYSPFFVSISFWLSIFIITIFALLPDFTFTIIGNSLSAYSFANLLQNKRSKLMH